MLELITGGSGGFYTIGAVLLAVLAIVWRAFRAGRQVERGKAADQTNRKWVQADDIIGKANAARRAARGRADTRLMSDDGHKRP